MMFNSNGEIDNALWMSEEWQNFYRNNLSINADIKDLFINTRQFDNISRLSTEVIATELDKDPKFVHLLLAIWQRHYCTFYKKYGRVDYDTENNIWVYKLTSAI